MRPIKDASNTNGTFPTGTAVLSPGVGLCLFFAAVTVRSKEGDLWHLALLIKPTPLPSLGGFAYICDPERANDYCDLELLVPVTEVWCLPCLQVKREARIAAGIPDDAQFLLYRP